MGTLLSVIAIILAVILLGMPFGPHFYVLAAVVAVLWAAAFTRPKASWFMASGLLVAFSAIATAPFEAPRRFLNQFRRAARGEGAEAETAAQTMSFYESMSDMVVFLEVGLVLVIIAALVLGVRRAADGAFHFMADASDDLAEFTVKVGKVASLLFLPMIVIIFYDVVQRKYLEVDPGFVDTWMFQTFTSTKLQELQWHMHAILFLLCFGFGYIKDAHVRIELVRDNLKPRTRVWIEMLGCMLFLLPYCFLVYAYGFDFAQKSFEIGEVSAALTGLPYRFIIKGFLPVGFTVLALAGFAVWLKCVVYLFGPGSLRDRTSYYAGTHHADLPEDVATDPAR